MMIRKDPARSIPRITLKLYTRGPLRLEPGLDFSISRSAAPAWQPAGARARIRPARRNVEVEPVKDARVGPGRVREADAAQRELPLTTSGLRPASLRPPAPRLRPCSRTQRALTSASKRNSQPAACTAQSQPVRPRADRFSGKRIWRNLGAKSTTDRRGSVRATTTERARRRWGLACGYR